MLGFILRSYGLGFGLPFQFHQDEPIVVNHALAYGAGDLNPHFFAIPPLTSYLLFLIYGLLYILGRLTGLWPGTEVFVLQFFKDPGVFYVSGRFFIGVIPGMLGVVLAYCFASKFLSKREALFSSAIMAFSFLNVVNSHYIYTDMLLVVFIILTYVFLFKLYHSRLMKYYFFTGASIGIATGVKYNGFFLFVPFLLTHLFLYIDRQKKNYVFTLNFFLKGICIAGITAVAAFFLTNPFSFMDFQGFLSSVLKQGGAFWYTGVKHHLYYSLVEGVSWSLLVTGIIGLILLMLRSRWGVIVASFPFLYYSLLVFRSQDFARYVLPVIPFLAAGSAYFMLGVLYNAAGNRIAKVSLIALSLLLIIPTSVKSVKADLLFSNSDTRIISADWISNNIPAGSKIACDSTFFRPVLKQPYDQIAEKERFLEEKGLLTDIKKKKFAYELAVLDPKEKGYPLYFLFKDPENQGQFSDTLPALGYDIEALKEKGIKYITVNGQVSSPEKEAFLFLLQGRADMIMGFSPYSDNSFTSMDPTATTCIPVKAGDIFMRKMTGPPIKIYKIR